MPLSDFKKRTKARKARETEKSIEATRIAEQHARLRTEFYERQKKREASKA
jgi:hypothetical protein